jgi:hypothetical protein
VITAYGKLTNAEEELILTTRGSIFRQRYKTLPETGFRVLAMKHCAVNNIGAAKTPVVGV